MQGVRGVVGLVLVCLFDLGVGQYATRRMWRPVTADALCTAVPIEVLSMTAGLVGMVIKGFGPR